MANLKIQQIPATTPESLAKYKTTFNGCDCGDRCHREGGSYMDEQGQRICKHIAAFRAGLRAPSNAAAKCALFSKLSPKETRKVETFLRRVKVEIVPAAMNLYSDEPAEYWGRTETVEFWVTLNPEPLGRWSLDFGLFKGEVEPMVDGDLEPMTFATQAEAIRAFDEYIKPHAQDVAENPEAYFAPGF